MPLTRSRPATAPSIAPATASTPLLAVRDLCRSFGRLEALRSVNLELAPGDRMALRGPNGAGKTTLLRCVAGTLAPSAGHVTVEGHPADSLPARRLIGISLSQERSFYLRLSGRENLRFFARMHGAPAAEARSEVAALEEELELEAIAERRVDRCSTGMVQRLSFARALLGAPKLLLLDEPTRSLDEAGIESLWAALDRRPRTAVLIATHHDHDAERCESQLRLAP